MKMILGIVLLPYYTVHGDLRSTMESSQGLANLGFIVFLGFLGSREVNGVLGPDEWVLGS